MKKLAWLGIAIVIILVAVITYAIAVPSFRDALYNSTVGTVLMPVHDWFVATWISIGSAGFTYIAGAVVGLMASGIIVGYIFNHWMRPKMPTWMGGVKTQTQPISYQVVPSGQVPQQFAIPQSQPVQTVPVTVVQQEETKK